MKTNLSITGWLALVALAIFNTQSTTAFAQGTAFTYQGQLQNNGSAANGSYDLQFTLYPAATGGGALAGPVTNTAVAVTNGLFTTLVNFGPEVFTGTGNWLQIAVSTNAANNYSALTPRQPVTPTPYALYSTGAGSAVTAGSAASVPATGIGAGTAGINIAGNAATATAAAVAGSADTANSALSASFAASAGLAETANTATSAAFAGLATNLSGVLPDAQLSANIARLNGTNGFAGSNLFSGPLVATNPANQIFGTFTGNGGGLSNLMNVSAAQLTSIGNTNGGVGNFFVGPSGNATMSGVYNTADGASALSANTSGHENTAYGYNALKANTVGDYNSANGAWALADNTSGDYNTAYGYSALNANTVGDYNTANGFDALFNNSSGSGNVANGYLALYNNYSGGYNTANGYQALFNNSSGSDNAANGFEALAENTSGSGNTANGVQALEYNTSGFYNTADGYQALLNSASGTNNIALGFQAGLSIYSGSSNIDIGNPGISADNNIIRIGSGQSQAFIAGVINGNGGGLTSLNASQLTSIGNANGGYGNFFVGPSGNATMSGFDNTANGFQALYANTSGYYNTANGYQALYANTSGALNTANGYEALYANTSGNFNTANGFQALSANTNGGNNTANGFEALGVNTSGSQNTAIGLYALYFNTSGNNNTANGNYALFQNTSGSYNIALGYQAGQNITNGNYNIDIGNQGLSADTNIIRIGTSQTACYLAGAVYANGTFVSSSDRNAKENIEAVDPREVLEKVAAMPVSRWNYKRNDPASHIGPMAQDFYAAFNVGPDDRHITTIDEGGVALAAIQGLNQKLNEKDAEIQTLEKKLDELQAVVKQLAAQK